MRYFILAIGAALLATSCGAPKSAQLSGSLDFSVDARYRSCDRDPSDELRYFSLAEVEVESLRVCLVAAAESGGQAKLLSSGTYNLEDCISLMSENPVEVRSGFDISHEIALSFERQKSLAEYPNERNFYFLSFAQIVDSSEECALVPRLTAAVPYLIIGDSQNRLWTIVVYFPQVTEAYLSAYGIDIDIDVEDATLAFRALLASETR